MLTEAKIIVFAKAKKIEGLATLYCEVQLGSVSKFSESHSSRLGDITIRLRQVIMIDGLA